MSGAPRISLVIPNLNSGPVLDRALQSILAQGDPALQLIMADGGSTDESRDVLERYRRHFDVVISEPDRGQADALNKGFRRADGELRGWLCADDELQPGALAHFREVFAAHPEAGVVTGACERVFPDGATWVQRCHPDPWSVIGVQNVIEQPSTLWRAEAHRRVGELDPGFHLGFDWDLWCRLRRAGVPIATTERVLSRYHFTADNKCGSAGNLFAREAYSLIKAYGPLRGWLAPLYRFVYERFDLAGCLDRPPTASRARLAAYRAFLVAVCSLGGRRWLRLYNWHFAALQQRGLRWW